MTMPSPYNESEEDRNKRLMLLCAEVVKELLESHARVQDGTSDPADVTTPTHPIGLSLEEKLCMLMRDLGELSSAVMRFDARKIDFDGKEEPTVMPRAEYDEHKSRIQKLLTVLAARTLGFKESIARWNTIGRRSDVTPRDPDPSPLDGIVLVDDPRRKGGPEGPGEPN
jgi:hypothetical protein